MTDEALVGAENAPSPPLTEGTSATEAHLTTETRQTDSAEPALDLSFPDVPRLELDELLQQLRDRADDVLATQGRLRGLVRANAAVVGDLSLPIVLRSVVESARELLGARYAALGVIDPDGNELEEFVHCGMEQDLVERIGTLPRGLGILGLLIHEPSPIRLTDLTTHGSAVGFPLGHPPMSGFLGVPIQVGGRVFGNLYVTERLDGRGFTIEDEQLALSLAATAGSAIANARLFAESEQRRRWLVAGNELTNRLLTPNEGRPMDLITSAAATAAEADFATLHLQAEGDMIKSVAAHGLLADELLGRVVSLTDSLPGRVVEANKPLLISDVRDTGVAMDLSLEVGPMILVPIATAEGVFGVLSLGRLANRQPFTEADLSMASSFSNQAAVALELVRARADQVQLVQVEDHDRIARDLHDHAIQEVFGVGLGLQALLPMIDKPLAVRRISEYISSLDRVITQIRSTIFQLNLGPQYGSLQGRLLSVANEYAAQLGFAPEVSMVASIGWSASDSLTDDLMAVAREALSNTARHAKASTVGIVLERIGEEIALVVTDNGRGIGNPDRLSGLTNMRHRAERHGGTVEFTTPDEGGTRIEWRAVASS